MRACAGVLIVAALGAPAAADDRSAVVDVEGAGGVVVPDHLFEPVNGQTVQPAAVGIVRALVSWVREPPPMPVEDGTAAYRVDLEPELAAGFIGNDRRGDGFAQAGLRIDVAISQHTMGLFRVSARGGVWLALRAGFDGGLRDGMVESDLGWYLWLGRSWRLGWEMGAIGVRNPVDSTGAAQPLYDDQARGVTTILEGAVFVGKRL